MAESYSVEARLSAVDSGLSKSLKGVIEAIQAVEKATNRLGEILIKVNCKDFDGKMESVKEHIKTIENAEPKAVISAKDKASEVIKEVSFTLKNAADKAEPFVLKAKDKATEIISSVTGKLKALGDSIFKPKVIPDDTQVEPKISKIRNALKSVTSGMLMGAGQAAFGAISNGLSEVMSGLDGATKSWKTFAGNMEILGASSKEIDSVTKSLQEYAQTTVYSASDMAGTYAQLAAVGVKDTEKLVKGFGGLAASAEEPAQAMKSLSLQATQMAARPTVAYEDFKILLQQTPAAMSAVAKAMGMTSSEMLAAVQEGTVETEKFFDAIIKVGTSDAWQQMATTPQTVGQAMDGLTETISNKLQPAYEKLSSYGISAMNALADAIGEMNFDVLLSWIDKAEAKVKELWQIFKETGAIQAVKTAFSDLSATFKDAFDALKNSGILEKVASALGQAVKMISEVISGITKAVSNLDFGGLGKAVTIVAGVSAGFAGLRTVVSKLSKLNPFKLFQSGAKKATSSVAQIISAIGTGLSGVIKSLGTALSGVIRSLGMFMSVANPVTLLAFGGALALVGAGIALIGTQGEGIAKIFEGIGTALGNTAPLVEALGTALGIITEAVGTAVATILPALAPLLPGIQAIMTTVAQVMGDTVVRVVQVLTPIAPAIEGMLASLSSMISSIVDVIGATIQKIADAFVKVVEQLSPIIDSIANLVTSLGDVIIGVVEAISGGIASVINAIAGIFQSLGEAALNAGKGFREMAKGVEILASLNGWDVAGTLAGMAAGLAGVAATAGGVGKAAGSFTKLNQAISAGVQVCTATIAGIMSLIRTISGMEQAMTKAANTAKKSGTDAGNGFVNGLKSGFSRATSAISFMLATMRNQLTGAVGTVNYLGQQIGFGLASGLNASASSVAVAAANLANAAERAIRAKAQINSPSRVAAKDGRYIALGLAKGMEDTQAQVERAMASLYNGAGKAASGSVLSMSDLGADYSSMASMIIEVPVQIDGHEMARITAPIMSKEIKRHDSFKSRLAGEVA